MLTVFQLFVMQRSASTAFWFDVLSMIAHGFSVAQLLVRNLEEDLVRDLKKRTGEPMSFWQMLSEMPELGDDDLFERERRLPRRVTEQDLFQD